jgi:N-acetylglucosamine kinase-like BadF-type ATPase
MILIADSGSTKTIWFLVDNGQKTAEYQTPGINPFYQSAKDIENDLREFTTNDDRIKQIYFYGAGCAFEDKKQIVRTGLQSIFKNAVIEINNDLLAACRALFLDKKGIACIMGTGSNSCFYNGKEIVENVSPLGFILGDEGSGAVLGKKLIADVLKNQLPENFKNKFLSQYNVTTAEILDNVYKQQFPNRYLAKFSVFLFENIKEKAIYDIVYNSFREFFVRNAMQYDYKNNEISFVGSIAWYFKETLQEVADDFGLKIGKIVQSPMEGLLEYHI